MRSPSRRAIALLVLNVLYCVVALAEDALPGWKMFAAVDRLAFELRDRDGRTVDVRDYLPRGAYLTDKGDLVRVARFVCTKERARAPFTLVEPTLGVRVEVGAGDCSVDAPR